MANLRNLGGAFNLGYFDGGTRGPKRGATNRGGPQRPAFKTFSKNPLKLRLVREIHMYIQMYIYIYIYVYLYMCIYIYIYIYEQVNE